MTKMYTILLWLANIQRNTHYLRVELCTMLEWSRNSKANMTSTTLEPLRIFMLGKLDSLFGLEETKNELGIDTIYK